MREAWRALYEVGAEVVINGHDHHYERFAPQDPKGKADPNGIREFVVGTGGGGQYEFRRSPNSEVRNNGSYGVLKLSLGNRTTAGSSWSLPASRFETAGARPASRRRGR